MLTLAQCQGIAGNKKAAADRDVDYFGTLIHEGWLGQCQQTTQDTLNALYAKAQAESAAHADTKAILDAQ